MAMISTDTRRDVNKKSRIIQASGEYEEENKSFQLLKISNML